MALTKYCDYGEIRAALGVNSKELGDVVLALPIYEIGLVRELNKVSTSLPAAFSASEAADPKTDIQQGLVDAVRLFSAYTVAKQVGVSLATLVPKDVGDGKANLSRFAGEPYTKTMDALKIALADARAGLEAALAAYEGSSTSTGVTLGTFFMASTRATDPVTGS